MLQRKNTRMKIILNIEFPDSAYGAVFAVLSVMVRALPNSTKVSIPKTRTLVFHGGEELILSDPTPLDYLIAEATNGDA